MKTTLHTYYFNLEKPEDREPYHQLKTRLEKEIGRGHRMHSIKSDRNFNPEAGEIEIEPEHLFGNQWNTNKGRLFDWYEEAIFCDGRENKLIKRGHWLEITPEMNELRRNTLQCGYTGVQFPAQKGYVFNETRAALGSPYLKESELYMLRLLPISEEFPQDRKPLTEAERAHLLPLYIAAQTKTNAKAREEQLAKIEADFQKTIFNATTERDGFKWLLEHGVQIENCIYYDHLGKFSFGWRSPYTGDARLALLEAIKGFPFEYDVK